MKKISCRLVARVMIIILAVVLTSILLVNLCFNLAFYNPTKEEAVNRRCFLLNLQMLSSSTSYGYINSAIPRGYFNFGQYDQEFFATKNSFYTDININYLAKGEFSYRMGKISMELETDSGFKDTVLYKTDFQVPAIFDSSDIKDGQFYHVLLKTADGASMETVLNEANAFYSDDPFLANNSGLIRIFIDTGFEDSEVVIGAPGTRSYIFIGSSYMEGKSAALYEMYFRDNLRFLAEHPGETALFLDSGLFGSLSIDYSDRLDYIQKNGIACLGATAYLSGDALKMIMHNSTVFQVIRVEEDLPNSKNDMTA